MKIREIRPLQLLQLRILKEFDRICTECGLTYYLAGGTLLGAVRHQGFIPWDVDIDVAMPRGDYERFKRLAPEKLGEEFVLQTEDDPQNPVFFSRIMLKGTSLYTPSEAHNHRKSAIHIDVFIIETVRRYPTWMEALLEWYIRLLLRLRAYRCGERDTAGRHRLLKKAALSMAFSGLYSFDNRRIVKLIEYLLVSKQDRGFSSMIHTTYGYRRELHRTADYGIPVRLPFEDGKYCAPANAHAILSRLYGDYMTPPQEEKRFTQFARSLQVDFGPYETPHE